MFEFKKNVELDTSILKKPGIRHINFENLRIFRVVVRFLVGNPDLTQGSLGVTRRGSQSRGHMSRVGHASGV